MLEAARSSRLCAVAGTAHSANAIPPINSLFIVRLLRRNSEEIAPIASASNLSPTHPARASSAVVGRHNIWQEQIRFDPRLLYPRRGLQFEWLPGRKFMKGYNRNCPVRKAEKVEFQENSQRFE